MALKPADLLNQLPSVSELLDKPPVRALADRWNRSVVAANLRSFLDEARSEIERRTAELPSFRELAERAARYVVSRQQQSLGVAINATGEICGSQWSSVPMAESAIERMIACSREFACASAAAADSSISPLACRLTGAQAATAVNSYSGALWLAMASLAADREVLVARYGGEGADLHEPLPALAAAARVVLREVGQPTGATTADYEAALSSRTAAILISSANETLPSQSELLSLARGRGVLVIDAANDAPLIDPQAQFPALRSSAQASIAAGANLVILRGDGLVGGPSCGMLLGDAAIIDRLRNHPLYDGYALDPPRSAALAATLACYDTPTHGADTVPVWQCLTASVENLRNRSERMAGQLMHVTSVASAVAVEISNPISSSWGVALSVTEGDVRELDNRLRGAHPSIVGRIENDRLLLDLRTVLPRQDKVIVDALLI